MPNTENRKAVPLSPRLVVAVSYRALQLEDQFPKVEGLPLRGCRDQSRLISEKAKTGYVNREKEWTATKRA